MAVSYKKLFHMMIEKGITNAQLQKQAGFSANIITRLKRGDYISLESIESICNVLICKVDDILEFVPNHNSVEGSGLIKKKIDSCDIVKIDTE
jgi:DNA-binding Xre family transcriptional regulator